jgi:hypothetical protein
VFSVGGENEEAMRCLSRQFHPCCLGYERPEKNLWNRCHKNSISPPLVSCHGDTASSMHSFYFRSLSSKLFGPADTPCNVCHV